MPDSTQIFNRTQPPVFATLNSTNEHRNSHAFASLQPSGSMLLGFHASSYAAGILAFGRLIFLCSQSEK
jgi:hypothetical protein